MNTKLKIALGAAMLVASSAASAEAEMIATASMSKAGGAVAIDMFSDGVVGFQARIKISDGVNTKVNTSKCLAALPATHKGTCIYNKDGSLFILAYSMSNTPLPKGHLALGQIGVSGPSAAKIEVTEFLATDVNNKAVNVSSSMGSDSSK